VRRKKYYKHLYHHKSDENIQKYKKIRRNVKKAMSEPMSQTYEERYWKKYTKNGEYDLYKMTKIRERKKKISTKLNVLRMRLIDFW
jgi:hypothetical protein